MKAALLHGIRDLRIQEVDVPKPADDEVLIRIRANGICGSDVHFYAEGRLGPFIVDRPYIPGHECIGEIVACGKDVRRRRLGERVVIEPGIPCRKCEWCRTGYYNLCPDVVFLSAPPINGTFAEYASVAEDFAHPVPESMTNDQGAMVEPVSVGLHAVNVGGVRAGHCVAVLGVGPIGLLTLQCALAAGAAEVIVADVEEKRLALARELGASQTIEARKQDVIKEVMRLTNGRGMDVVFETAGRIATQQQTVQIVRRGGTIVFVGWAEERNYPFDMAMLMEKEATLRGINRYRNVFPEAIRLISAGRINTQKLVTHHFVLDNLKQAMELCLSKGEGIIKAIVTT